jgi:hypothetical protein
MSPAEGGRPALTGLDLNSKAATAGPKLRALGSLAAPAAK